MNSYFTSLLFLSVFWGNIYAQNELKFQPPIKKLKDDSRIKVLKTLNGVKKAKLLLLERYDEQGKLLEEISYKGKSPEIYVKYTYENPGNVAAYSLKKGKLQWKKKYINNYLAEIKEFDNKGIEKLSKSFKYIQDTIIASIEEVKEKRTTSIHFTYNENFNLIRKYKIENIDTIQFSYYEYDVKGNLIRVKTVDKRDRVTEAVAQYDEFGLQQVRSIRNSKFDESSSYAYDQEGRITRIDYLDKKGETVKYREYSYNGNRLKEMRYYYDNQLRNGIEYFYDFNENLIKHERFKGNRRIFEKKEISYNEKELKKTESVINTEPYSGYWYVRSYQYVYHKP